MTLARRLTLCCVVLCCGLHLVAQRAIVSNQAADLSSISTNSNPDQTTNPAGTASSRVLSFSDTLEGQPDGALTVTFALYPDQQSATALWTETQLVQVASGKYTALLGSTTAQGIPEAVFAADQAHWLGVQANGAERRLLLVSVPYAVKAMEADRLGGLLPSQYVTTAQLQTILQNSAATTPATTTPQRTSNSAIQTAAAVGTTPQPATDFTDNNGSEVLLVTQQGPGYAIHAISNLEPAVYAENSDFDGIALQVVATSTTGANTGLLAQSLSSNGVAGVFDSAGPAILVLKSKGVQVMSFDQFGDINANGQVQANNFVGGGFGLTNIPPSAVGAQSGNFPNAIVVRDFNGGFAAGTISAQDFVGSGFGLTDISPAAVGAQSGNFPNAIVQRDVNGSFAAGQISAQNFIGNGIGLTNISPLAVGAQSGNFSGAIVQRDINGDFAAGQISAQNFIGNGFGLTNVPPAAVGAQFANFPGAIVMRDNNGNFAASQITASGLFLSGSADFTGAISTAPVKSVLSVNTPTTCMASKELLIKTDAPTGQQLFICNATGNGYVLLGDGTAAGVTGLAAGDSSIAIGGTSQLPSVSVANGGITTAKLAAGAVVGSITDGSLTPAKIAGTAATLGANTFSGNQIVQGSLAAASLGTGPLSATSGLFSGGGNSDNQVSIKQDGSTAALIVTANGLSATTAINASSIEGDAIDARTTYNYAVNAASNNGVGVLASGGDTGIESSGNNFGVKASGATALVGNGTNIGVVANASAASGVALSMATGTAGKFLSGSSSAGQPFFTETFNVDAFGNIFSAGAVSAPFPNGALGTLDSRLARLDGAGGVQHSLATDASGIIGVVMNGEGSTGNAQIAYSGVVNCLFDTPTTAGDYVVNSSRTDGDCSDGGSAYPSSGQVVGRVLRSSSTTGVVPILLFGSEVRGPAGALSFSQIIGTASAAQLPAAVVYNNQDNTLTGTQTINGSLTVGGPATVVGTLAANSLGGDGSGVFNVNAAKLQGLTPADLATSGALALETSQRQAADTTLQSNLSAETTARQSDVANLQSGLTAESSARAAGDTSLQTSINGEITARQSDVASLQTSVNNLSAADAKLAASNTFTAGTQDFSGAGATLPVRSVLTANTPATCVAGKELIIKTDAPAGQQLFICDASGATWDLVGDGASGGVTSFNGRNGSVSPATNDYSFSQISGSLAASQLPALTGDVTTSSGSSITVLASTGVASGSYSKVTVDLKGRVTSGAQASFADLTGSVIQSQLPVFTVFNNQVNTFSASQTVNGTLTANLFSGNGSSLSNVNAATLNGFPSSTFAQLSGVNTFSGEQVLSASNTVNPSLNMPPGVAPATPIAGDVWNTGSALQYRDNASTTQSLVSTPQSTGMQLLKLTASITPGVVSAQVCTEQSFTVTGLNATDLLLTVAQPSTKSPGTNIAIGGWRVSAANTVAIQFCNVSRSNNTPSAGVYTFALMR